MKHPNAFAAAVTTGLAALLLKVAQRYGYAELTDAQALGIAGFAITTVLFAGRRVLTLGIKGVLVALWRGSRKVAVGSKPPPPAAKSG